MLKAGNEVHFRWTANAWQRRSSFVGREHDVVSEESLSTKGTSSTVRKTRLFPGLHYAGFKRVFLALHYVGKTLKAVLITEGIAYRSARGADRSWSCVPWALIDTPCLPRTRHAFPALVPPRSTIASAAACSINQTMVKPVFQRSIQKVQPKKVGGSLDCSMSLTHR